LGATFQEPSANGTIPPASPGAAAWERLYDLDVNSLQSGIHAFAFAEHGSQQAIVVYRGACLDPSIMQCRSDRCVLSKFETFGRLTPTSFGTEASNGCQSFGAAELDYLGQARRLVEQVQARLPGYAILLTGHSMGGFLASLTAAQHLGDVQAVTFAPAPFYKGLTEGLGLSHEQILALPASDIVAVCDPYDCGVNTMEVPLARLGATTCLFDHQTRWEEPLVCSGVHRGLESGEIRPVSLPRTMVCKGESHAWERYKEIIPATEPDSDQPHHLPTCSSDYSTKTEPLIAAMRFDRQLQQLS